MSMNVFGGGPADVTADSNGNISGGITLKVYTAALGGQRVTELYDLDGEPLSGVVVSGTSGDDEGRVAFQASDNYQLLFLDAGYGMRWAVPAREAFSAAYTALSKSEEALSSAQEAQAIAAESGVKADLAKAEVDAKLGFDITKLSPEYVTHLRGNPGTVVQSFARDPMTGQYYGSQGIGDIGGTSNLVVHKFDPDGSLIDTCTFEGGGHGSTTALENDGQDVWLWFRWTYDSTNGGYTNRMVRAKYQPGKTVKRNDSEVIEVMDTSGNILVNYDIDQAADRIALRTSLAGRRELYTLHRLSDYKSNRNEPLAQLDITWEAEDGPFQGHCTLDEYLYVSRGNADSGSTNTITRFHWDTGSRDVIDIDDVGRTGDTWPGGRNEAEGVSVWRGKNGTPSLLIGKAVGSYGYRQSLVYAFNPPAGDDLRGETVRSTNVSIQTGRELVTPSGADVVTTFRVRFDHEYEIPPTVMVTPSTVARHQLKNGNVAVTNTDTTGFDIVLLRGDTIATWVDWMAYGGPGFNQKE